MRLKTPTKTSDAAFGTAVACVRVPAKTTSTRQTLAAAGELLSIYKAARDNPIRVRTLLGGLNAAV